MTFYLRRQRHLKPGEPDTFRLEVIEQYLQQFNSMAATITMVAAGVVGISLLVGGVGIMNIMLVSVSERTREIGLRKAVGARPAAILLQFLIEAVMICLIGGLIGRDLRPGSDIAHRADPAGQAGKGLYPRLGDPTVLWLRQFRGPDLRHVPGHEGGTLWTPSRHSGMNDPRGQYGSQDTGETPVLRSAFLWHGRSARVPVVIACLPILISAIIGCRDEAGLYPSPVSTAQLRQIEPMMMRPSTTAPTQPRDASATTLPATLPATFPAATTAPAQVELNIEECRRLCLENNLDLKVQLLNPTIARQAISEEEARFESLFFANSTIAQSDAPAFTGVGTNVTGTQSSIYQIEPGLKVPLMTGGDITISSPLARSDSGTGSSSFNPAYASDFSASISQPLLRNAGVQANTQAIRIARLQYQATQAQTKLEVIRVLASVDRVYWRLYAARRELEVRKQEYDLAQAQLERARRMVRAGQAAEVEIIRAESGVADRIEAIITADNQVRDRQRDLKRILNQPGLDMDSPTIVVPQTKPTPVHYAMAPESLAHAALRNRAEMLSLELRIAQDTSTIAFARNQMLPLVRIAYTYNVNGLARARRCLRPHVPAAIRGPHAGLTGPGAPRQ